MLTVNALPPRPMPTDHGGAPPSGTDASTDGTGFSSMLRQTQAGSAPASAAGSTPGPQAHAAKTDPHAQKTPAAQHDASAPDDADAAQAPDDAPPALTPGRTRTALKLAAREPDTASRDVAPEAPKPEIPPTGDAPTSDAHAPDAAAAPPAALDPAIAHWLAGQQRTPAAGQQATSGEAPARTTTAPAGEAPAARLHAAKEAPADPMVTKDRASRTPDAVAPVPAFAAVLAEQRVAERTTSSPADKPVEAVGAAAFAPAPTATRDVSAPLAVAVPTPVASPDFAQALGLQMSVLAKDGIQHAELHLNPAEMGPVSVQIVMDGTQARVDFGADVAATRQAIEAGLPELASALRDAGFTLAGGGVSQHAGGRSQPERRSDGDGTQRTRQRVSDEGIARVGAAARHSVTRGGLDLYA